MLRKFRRFRAGRKLGFFTAVMHRRKLVRDVKFLNVIFVVTDVEEDIIGFCCPTFASVMIIRIA